MSNLFVQKSTIGSSSSILGSGLAGRLLIKVNANRYLLYQVKYCTVLYAHAKRSHQSLVKLRDWGEREKNQELPGLTSTQDFG